MRLRLETGIARTAGRLSRIAGRGGGTTLPGRLLAAVDPDAVSTLAARLPLGSAVVSATNGKTTTAAMAAEILASRAALAHNAAGANLVSGVASALLERPDAELGLFEVDEAAMPAVVRSVRPRVLCLGNLFRDQLDRYGELELVAERWREAVASLPPGTRAVVNGDDPLVASLAEGRQDRLVFGIDDPGRARPAVQHAADSKYCIRCGAPYDYRAAYVGHLGDYRCPACGHARPVLDVAARAIEFRALEGVSFELAAGGDTHPVRLRLPGLYNVYNALAAASLCLALGVPLDEITEGLARARPAFGRFERIAVGDRLLLVLLIKNPAGANEAVRTLVEGAPPPLALLALNDGIADGRDVSWIWDVDFEPLFPGLGHAIVSGERAAELGLRFSYGGFAGRLDVVPELEAALDLGLSLAPAGSELPVLPTYTAMLALQGILTRRGHAAPYWERRG